MVMACHAHIWPTVIRGHGQQRMQPDAHAPACTHAPPPHPSCKYTCTCSCHCTHAHAHTHAHRHPRNTPPHVHMQDIPSTKGFASQLPSPEAATRTFDFLTLIEFPGELALLPGLLLYQASGHMGIKRSSHPFPFATSFAGAWGLMQAPHTHKHAHAHAHTHAHKHTLHRLPQHIAHPAAHQGQGHGVRPQGLPHGEWWPAVVAVGVLCKGPEGPPASVFPPWCALPRSSSRGVSHAH